MTNIEQTLKNKVMDAVQKIYEQLPDEKAIQIQRTRKDFKGDFTLVVFPLLRITKKPPEQTANEIGEFLKREVEEISDYNVIKGFLNLSVDNNFWISFLNTIVGDPDFGLQKRTNPKKILIEYSSPNTNKPLHLGHIRNNLLGYSVATILETQGHEVVKVNLVNDRGIHICKSMLAWQKWGNNLDPDKADKKGDHLVGDFYVKFDQEYKKEVNTLLQQGMNEEDAKKKAPLIAEAQEMLRKWEARDPEVIELWKEMNRWVLDGFDITYKNLGVDFDKIYFESDTYKLGKQLVLQGLDEGVFYKKEDGSVWADLTDEGLDEKLLLRADGTSVYMTQDLGTANQRHDDFNANELIYVVGNEQNYHFQVLRILLSKLGFSWAEQIHHLSYGMVELPEGKMKSREGTVVDADDLIEEMVQTAESMSKELGKLDGFEEQEKNRIIRTIGLGALKYFILKVDPKKSMTFNPKESIDFNGNTGPFIQYSYTRIQSLIKKAKDKGLKIPEKTDQKPKISSKELQLIKILHQYPEILTEAAANYSPAVIANYIYEVAKEYNQFYHDHPILSEEKRSVSQFRLLLSVQVGRIIRSGMKLLGIDVPERM
ncbi:MAG: arginine--tRNA ligase [Bacteroidales bacterium]|jgi:arginyl-tRNA synthetase|nr:arginine--tRNA ligase [Bacteroidales bacterium]